MRTFLFCGSAICVAAGLAAVNLLPQDPMQQQDPPDMEAMMEAWMAASVPGEHHQHLNPLVGTWDITTRFRMEPDGEWMTSAAKAKCEWVLGGRFVHQHVSATGDEMMPADFEGIGYLGYDNIAGNHTCLWMDTMSTSTLLYTGECSADGRTFTFKTEYFDPFTKSKKPSKWVYRIVSDDEVVMEMHETDPSGTVYMHAEITYKRAKAN